MSCQGWLVDGGTRVNLCSPTEHNLHETKIAKDRLIEITKYDLPSSAMLYQSRAYRDDLCYRRVMSGFDTESKRMHGKTFFGENVANVIACQQTYVIDLGKLTLEESRNFLTIRLPRSAGV